MSHQSLYRPDVHAGHNQMGRCLMQTASARDYRVYLTAHAPDADDDDAFGMCIAYPLRALQPSEQGRAQLFIQWLVVHEDRRGQGWGRYLMQRTLWEARQLGYRDTILGTSESNHRAVLLYTSLGYRVVQTSYAFSRQLRDT